MRVRVYLTLDGVKETVLEGEAGIFGTKPGELVVRDLLELRDIGFWLTDWRYHFDGVAPGRNNKSRVFIPWGSALFIEEVVDGKGKVENETVRART